MPPSPSQVLRAEQAHLDASRAALQAMREASADWSTALAGNAVSTEILRQQLYRRVQSLQDLPDVPLFFGRLDYARELGAELDEVVHVGRRHVSAELGGDPLVVDWRAPLCLAFYRARPGEPMGAELRRRFGFSQGTLTAYEDEDLTSGTGGPEVSAMLLAEIERPRSGPMRDIVATIQPDQDVLVRTELAQSLAVQGAPGTGKTAVGLHRAAYLLYAYRDQLSRQGVLVIGPNDSFLRYIGDVLPALGEIDATQETVDSLLAGTAGVQVRGQESAAAATLKGDARLAQVIARAIWGRIGQATEMLVVPIGSRQWRVPAGLVNGAVHALIDKGIRYESGRQLLPQRLAHQVLLRMEAAGEITDDRIQNAVARHKAVTSLASQLWPVRKADQVVFELLSDPDALSAAADGLLSPDEQSLLLDHKRARSVRSYPWTPADLALLDEAADQLVRTGSLGHLIVDEAQDLSAMQLRALGRRASTGSVTLLGDLAQATTPWASTDWSDALGHLGKPDATLAELTEGFRVPPEVIDFAARLLPAIAPGLTPPSSMRSGGGGLVIQPTDDPAAATVAAARAALQRPGTVGLIVSDADLALTQQALAEAGLQIHDPGDPDRLAHRLDLVPASLAKGLEFDHVVLVEPAAIVGAESTHQVGLRRLYVCLTRAVSSLTIVHERPLPVELHPGR